jgi:hemolysin III
MIDNQLSSPIKFPLPQYTDREDKINTRTHFVGALLSVAGAVYLISRAVVQGGGALRIASTTIYALTLVNLFVWSTLYHSTKNEKRRRFLQKLDHLSIAIVVAGSVTGVAGGALDSAGGYFLIGFAWVCAATATTLNLINVKAFRAPALACYIGAGWSPVLFIAQLYEACGYWSVALLLGGGVFYMGGLAFYAVRKPYFHCVFHVAVILGAATHFINVALFVL